MARALSPPRHAQILVAAFRFVTARPQLPLALIALATVVSGWRPASRGSQGHRAILVALLVVAAGFYAVYLTTPYDLGWQLASSLDRLFIQYWPVVVLGGFVGGLDLTRDDSARTAPAKGSAAA